MKRNLVGVMAVSIAALLFAGCGGSGLSPAQKERCEELRSIQKGLRDALGRGGPVSPESAIPEMIQNTNKELADRGC